MADFPIPISALPPASTPLTGNEVIPLVQGGATKAALASSIVLSTVFSPSQGGVVPASGGGTATALRADGTWTSTFTGTWVFATVNVTGVVTATSLLLGPGAAPAYDSITGNIAYIARTAAEISAGVTPTSFAYEPLTVDRYGTNTTPGTTNMLPAINAAISVASAAGGGTVMFGPKTYFHSAAIALSKFVILQGDSRIGTVLLSTHTGDGITSTWPVNSSTAVHVKVANLTVKNTNAGNTGAGFVDIGGTFVNLEYVKVSGFKYSVIFCQTELGDIDFCDFEFPLTGGLWLVNGNDYSGAPSANPGFTNRIGVYRSQFNSSVGTGTAIIDDGGASHSYTDLSVDGWLTQGRFAGCESLKLSGGEWEASSAVPWVFTNLTSINSNSVTPCYGLTIIDPFIGATGACMNVVLLHQTAMIGGYFGTLAAAAVTGASNILSVTALDVAFASTTLFDSNPGSFTEIDLSGVQTNRKVSITSNSLQMISGAIVEQRSVLAYGTTVALNAALGNTFQITANNGTAFTVSNPTNPADGQRITVRIFNVSGGALGTVTWGTAYKMSTWTSPATGNTRSVDFEYNVTNSAWYQTSPENSADVPI